MGLGKVWSDGKELAKLTNIGLSVLCGGPATRVDVRVGRVHGGEKRRRGRKKDRKSVVTCLNALRLPCFSM